MFRVPFLKVKPVAAGNTITHIEPLFRDANRILCEAFWEKRDFPSSNQNNSFFAPFICVLARGVSARFPVTTI